MDKINSHLKNGLSKINEAKFNEAEQDYANALMLSEKEYGENHEMTCTIFGYLARCILYQGKTNIALPMFERLVLSFEKIYQDSEKNLKYKTQGKYAAALYELADAYARMERYDEEEATKVRSMMGSLQHTVLCQRMEVGYSSYS